ncbi:MAG: hypothetical protein ACE5KE_09155 [Methanosarcinales archaeon]
MDTWITKGEIQRWKANSNPVSIIAVVSGIAIYGSLKALNLLRVDEEIEEVGLDESLYEMDVYPEVPIGSGESS